MLDVDQQKQRFDVNNTHMVILANEIAVYETPRPEIYVTFLHLYICGHRALKYSRI